MMILQVRGTSGSGKTTAVRTALSDTPKQGQFIDGRRKPLYYTMGACPSNVYLLGHYESACGGCDNVGSARAVYDVIQKIRQTDPAGVILCEGLLLSEDVKWTTQLHQDGHAVSALFLTTHLDTCIDQIKSRRAAAGNTKPFNTKNTTNRVKTIERARIRLTRAGVKCRRVSFNQSVKLIREKVRSVT